MNRRLKAGDKAPNFQFDTPWRFSQDFYKNTPNQNVIFVFLRYYGCPICRMEMANLKREIKLFNRGKSSIFVFLQSSIATVLPVLKEEDWPFNIVCDPTGILFQLYAVEHGGLIKYLHPAGLIAAIKATSRGFMHKKFEGRETQLPAAFVIKSDKTIAYAYYGKNIGDVPKPSALAENL